MIYKLESKNADLTIRQMKIAYWIAKENVAFRKFRDLNMLVLNNYDTEDLNYANDRALREFLASISFIIEQKTLNEIRESPFFSIITDESTDTSTQEQLILYAKYFSKENSEFKMSFLSIMNIPNKKAQTINEYIVKFFSRHNLN